MVRGKDRRVELGYSLALQYRRYYTHQNGTKLGGNFSQSDLFYLIAFFSGGRPTHQRTETADTTQTQQKNKHKKQCESEYSCCIPCTISTGIIVAAHSHIKLGCQKVQTQIQMCCKSVTKSVPTPLGSVDPISKPYLNLWDFWDILSGARVDDAPLRPFNQRTFYFRRWPLKS